MSVARTPGALVLDVESCNQLAGCPGCGVIAQGHGRMVVEVIDAPWAGVPVRIRWHKRRWICRETTCQTVTFLEHDERVCAPRARLGVRAIRWAIRQLRFEGATILGLARQLGTTWNTVWSHIKPYLQAASDDPARFAGVQVLGVDEHVWHHQDRRHRGPRELTGIVDLTRGEDHPTARLLVAWSRWACAQVVDGLFMRLLSRPLGVVRIRWGICRRGWCGCGGGCRSLRSRWRPRCRPGRGW